MRRVAGLCLALLLAAMATARAAPPVDLALVLAVDASRSVDVEEFDLQRSGYVAAFRDPRIARAVSSGAIGAIAVVMFQWSGARLQQVVVPWTILASGEDCLAFALAIEKSERHIFGGGTSVSGAIDFGVLTLGRVPAEPIRRVIDISGDGSNNNGRLPVYARDEAVAQGVVINGLTILNDEPMLDIYYRQHVIGGPGAFVVATSDYETFSQAILDKLVREIASDQTFSPSIAEISRSASSSVMP
jgi:hypothetical protein